MKEKLATQRAKQTTQYSCHGSRGVTKKKNRRVSSSSCHRRPLIHLRVLLMNHAPKNTEYKHKRQIRLYIIAQSALLLLKESFCNISSQRRTTTTTMQAGNVETPRTKLSTNESHESSIKQIRSPHPRPGLSSRPSHAASPSPCPSSLGSRRPRHPHRARHTRP